MQGPSVHLKEQKTSNSKKHKPDQEQTNERQLHKNLSSMLIPQEYTLPLQTPAHPKLCTSVASNYRTKHNAQNRTHKPNHKTLKLRMIPPHYHPFLTQAAEGKERTTMLRELASIAAIRA
eukprot:CAMPEP_0196739206 /NCGR_PEP_ID=MMETSP1091-20130531/20765_1 /TAXON_ID=302021 /ORGANISM="Rhodomonas sp., Strain CCMP768" /LENGTH=119 /DNA_ID=CAMNT_0042083601 /DNA_START=118 /DNA_END=474 /DNA_ORIENTATION=-